MRALPCLLLLACALPANARTLRVGPGAEYDRPGAAIAAAAAGDRVEIAPGRYTDCAVIRQPGLVVAGTGLGVVLEGPVCEDKALLVVDAPGVTLRDLTLRGARSTDGNGAGVRAEGGDLLLLRMRLLDDQDGVLTNDDPRATLTVRYSEFVGDGACLHACAHGIYAAHIARLVVTGSHFVATREGHAIKSRARATEVRDTEIRDGPDGTGSYQIDAPEGGDVLVEGNRLEKGPHSGNPDTAIMIGEERADAPTPRIVVRGNHLDNHQDRRTTFVRNFTTTPATLDGNGFSGPVQPLAEGWLDRAGYRAGRAVQAGRQRLGLE